MLPAVLICMAAGATTLTWGSLASGPAKPTGMETGPTPFILLEFDPRMIRSAPMPLVRCLWSFSMPMKMPTMERIMTTSMATARMLMMERRGRWSRLAKMSLFMPVYRVQETGYRVQGAGSGGWVTGLQLLSALTPDP